MKLGRGLLVLTLASLLTAACDWPGAVAGVQQFALRTKDSEPVRITPGPDHQMWFTEFTAGRIATVRPGG